MVIGEVFTGGGDARKWSYIGELLIGEGDARIWS